MDCEFIPAFMNVIVNNIKRVEDMLNQHRLLGSNSTLSVLEVAQLMDVVKKREETNKSTNEISIFQYSVN